MLTDDPIRLKRGNTERWRRRGTAGWRWELQRKWWGSLRTGRRNWKGRVKKKKKGEADGNEGGGGESEEEVDGKNQSKWCRKKYLWKWLIKPIKKTSALSSVSPVCWAENVDPTQILPQAWGIWETPIKAKRPMVLIWWGSFAMFGWKHVSTEAFWSYYMSK